MNWFGSAWTNTSRRLLKSRGRLCTKINQWILINYLNKARWFSYEQCLIKVLSVAKRPEAIFKIKGCSCQIIVFSTLSLLTALYHQFLHLGTSQWRCLILESLPLLVPKEITSWGHPLRPKPPHDGRSSGIGLWELFDEIFQSVNDVKMVS